MIYRKNVDGLIAGGKVVPALGVGLAETQECLFSHRGKGLHGVSVRFLFG